MVCNNCGKKHLFLKNYCSNCGSNLEKQVTLEQIQDLREEIKSIYKIIDILEQKVRKINKIDSKKFKEQMQKWKH